ncbi:hypothetical protein WN48_02297 [Eufriesea mexicana]|nr:hypothetical protein WN48_02297 [Eufriesea mexicana]
MRPRNCEQLEIDPEPLGTDGVIAGGRIHWTDHHMIRTPTQNAVTFASRGGMGLLNEGPRRKRRFSGRLLKSLEHESGHRLDSGSPFWRIQLDQDLLDTISAIYPEWFKDYTNTRASTSSSSSTSGGQLNTEGIVAADASAGLDHKVAKGDSKSKSKAKKADSLKDKERDRKEARRESKDER